MEEFQRSVNSSVADANERANRLAQEMALQALLNYEQGGNAALGTYRDKDHPAVVAETFGYFAQPLEGTPCVSARIA